MDCLKLLTSLRITSHVKGMPVCTQDEEDQMRWHSSLIQLSITKNVLFHIAATSFSLNVGHHVSYTNMHRKY